MKINRKTLLLLILASIGFQIKLYADSGVPGLGEAMLLIIIGLIIGFILLSLLNAFIALRLMNKLHKTHEKISWYYFIAAACGHAIAFFSHDIGDLSYSNGYLLILFLSGFFSASLAYFIKVRRSMKKANQ
ncbi:MAG: hypothetical protein NXI09_10980 [Bacteroidetes bacterium]|nr:hypothetical protein [Bacteroidota bacterium]